MSASSLGGVDSLYALIPDSPVVISQLASELRTLAAEVDRTRHRIHRVEIVDGWRGTAHDSYQRCAERLPGILRTMSTTFHAAARAAERYARELEAARAAVRRALGHWADGDHATRVWQRRQEQEKAQLDQGSCWATSDTDPGDALRSHAQREADEALSVLDDGARRFANTLQRLALDAPPRTMFAKSLGRQLSDLGGGVVAGVWEAGDAMVRFSPTRILANREGWLRDVDAALQGLNEGGRHPGAMAAAVADTETLHENPERWVGTWLPTVAATAATAGGAESLTAGERVAATAPKTAARIPSVIRTLDEMDALFGMVGLPATDAFTKVSTQDLVRQLAQTGHALEGSHGLTPEQRERLAEDYGGDADDYERRRGTITVDGHDVEIEWTQNRSTGEQVEARLVRSGT